MIKKAPIKEKGLVRVTFELPSTVWAERVNLVGEFNDWDTMSTPMTRRRADANWKAIVELETGRRYRFRYLVDGKQWLNDWHADEFVENPYGSDDSVVDLTEVGEPHHSAVVPTTGDDPHLSTTACPLRE
jgi:1,4-alpha-glucan branching enzyme